MRAYKQVENEMKYLTYLIKKPVLIIFFIISIVLLIIYFSLNINNLTSLVLVVVGFIIWIKGIFDLKENFSISPQPKNLVAKGIYSKIRHPIYVGQALVSIAWCVLIRSIFLVIFVIGISSVLIIRARMEERTLIRKFGKRYEKYKKQTWI